MNRLTWFDKIKAEGGMTMVEVTFASVTLLGAVIIMMSMFDTSVGILSFTTTRSIATQIATEEIENIRSMDYEQANNKIPTSWPDDPDLSTTSTPVKYRDVNDDGQSLWRDVIATASVGLDMERMVVRKNINFTIRNYVLWADDATTTHAYKRLVVKISWATTSAPGEVMMTSNFAKTDVSEPRPAVTIVGVKSTNFNYFSGANEDTTMSVDDSIRGPASGVITPIVYARAQSSSAKSTGISKVVFTLIEPDGDAYSPVTVTTTDSQGYWPWSLNTMSPRIPDNTGYLIKAEAFDSLGHSDVTALRINIDNTPPPAPTGFDTLPVSGSAYQIKLVWDWSADSSDTVSSLSRFVINRRKVSGAGAESSMTPRLAVPESYREFIDAIASSGRYAYNAMAVDTAGNLGISGIFKERDSTSTPSDTQSPLLVSAPTAQAISWKSIYLDWDDVADLPDPGGSGISGYFIRGSDNQVNWILVGETTLDGTGAPTAYQDPGLKPGKQYWYIFKAFDGEGNQSTSSTPISARTPLR